MYLQTVDEASNRSLGGSDGAVDDEDEYLNFCQVWATTFALQFSEWKGWGLNSKMFCEKQELNRLVGFFSIIENGAYEEASHNSSEFMCHCPHPFGQFFLSKPGKAMHYVGDFRALIVWRDLWLISPLAQSSSILKGDIEIWPWQQRDSCHSHKNWKSTGIKSSLWSEQSLTLYFIQYDVHVQYWVISEGYY